MNLLQLPNIILIEVFEYLSYEDCSKIRLVCRRFDQISQQVLNCGFNRVIKQHAVNFRRIKSLLPRRESERRNHCLARHADILLSIETRISMLSMTYSKYIDLSLCCFIPGRVLDEIFRILRLISKSFRPLRPHEVLQELRDISSMAIEHFDEKIATSLKQQADRTSTESNKSTSSSSNSSSGSWVPNTVSSQLYTCICGGTQRGASFAITSGKQLAGSSSFGESSSTVVRQDRCCPDFRAYSLTLSKYKSLYKKAVQKINYTQRSVKRHSHRLKKACKVIVELRAQAVDLKKRLEDVEAKNLEHFANMKQKQIEETNAVSCSLQKVEVSNDVKPLEVVESKPTTSISASTPIKKRRYEETLTNSLSSTVQSGEISSKFIKTTDG